MYLFIDYIFEFPDKFVEFVRSRDLETLKQAAIYVGLDKKSQKSANVNSRISVPRKITKV